MISGLFEIFFSLKLFTIKRKQFITIENYINHNYLYLSLQLNESLPDWTKSIYPSSWLDEITILHFTLPSFTPALSKFRTGYILKEILDRSMSKVNGTLSPDISVYQYSAHDINISSTLVALGMFDVSLKN